VPDYGFPPGDVGVVFETAAAGMFANAGNQARPALDKERNESVPASIGAEGAPI